MMQGHTQQAPKTAIRLFDRQFSYTHLIAAHQKCRLILALDIGGGNCSAAVLHTRTMDKLSRKQKITAIQSIFTEPGKFKTFSVIGYKKQEDGSEDVYIGEDAERYADYIFTNFKEVPATGNLKKMIQPDGCGIGDERSRSRETLMRDFIRKLYKSITSPENNSCFAGLGRDEILVLVGKPSSKAWNTPEALANYKRIITEATGGDMVRADDQVWTLSESSASILYMLKAFPPNGTDRILIIDLGAFSADITYLDRSTGEILEASITLGGKAVDRNIKLRLRSAMSKAQSDALKEELFDYFVRIGKENHWPAAEDDAVFKLSAQRSIRLSPGDMRACVDSDPFPCDSMNGMSQTLSYAGHLRAFLADFMAAHCDQNGVSRICPDEVLIVGGAANMTPAYEAIWSFVASRGWQADIHPEADGFTDDLIQYAVPKGMLIYYARTIPFVQELPALKDQLRACFKNLLIPRLSVSLSQTLTDPIMNENTGVAIKAAIQWSQETASLSCNDLLSRVSASLAGSDRLQALYAQAIASACASTQTVIVAQNTALPHSLLSAVTMPDKSTSLQCSASVNDALVRILSDYVSGLYTVGAITAAQQAQIHEGITASLNAMMSSLLQPQIQEVITYLIETAILPKFVEDIIFALILVPALLIGAVMLALDKVLDLFHQFSETPEQYAKRMKNASEAQKKQEEQKKQERAQKMATPRSAKEREKLLKKLRTETARKAFDKALKEHLPERLPSILGHRDFDDLRETLLSSLQEEIEKAAFC